MDTGILVQCENNLFGMVVRWDGIGARVMARKSGCINGVGMAYGFGWSIIGAWHCIGIRNGRG